MVSERYFIKLGGDNAPMNIAPTFKLGMNVKEMTHYSTTKDAVNFPDKIKAVVRTVDIDGREGLKLEDVLLTPGISWKAGYSHNLVSVNGNQLPISQEQILGSYLTYHEGKADIYHNNQLIFE